ncbi:MAG: hypothetical protein GY694_13340, partial [Gammaproteobacteria bacterium]|nr:hypothetical protein [Gammaproteobacteria bacterium]
MDLSEMKNSVLGMFDMNIVKAYKTRAKILIAELFVMLVMAIVVAMAVVYPCKAIASKKFFEERYRGWMWFEEKEEENDERQEKMKLLTLPTAEEARKIIEQKKKDLDDARNIMLSMAYSTKYDKKDYLQAVKKYRRLEI